MKRTPSERRPAAAIGFRAHSGWAVAVALRGPIDAPTILDRRRFVLADPNVEGSKQPYHAAVDFGLSRARTFVQRCTSGTRTLARRAVRAIVRDIEKRGNSVVGCGNLLSSALGPVSLEQALASHPMLHTAEGLMFRNALSEAAEHQRLTVTGIGEKQALATTARELRIPEASIRRRLADIGSPMGPPWRQDEKLAAAAAWLVLAAKAKKKTQRKLRWSRDRRRSG